jgi:hypothetical protein
MRVVCSRESDGNVYRIYRDHDGFVAQMKRLVPFLASCSGNVSIGGTDDDPDVVLVVGPLDAATDEAFQKRMRTSLS